MNRRRLDAEEIRDACGLSGQLDLTRGGRRCRPGPTSSGSSDHGQCRQVSRLAQASLRLASAALYLPVIRSGLYDLFQAFDFADPSVVTGRRETTTVAPQALFLMNSDLVWEAQPSRPTRLLKHGGDEAGDGAPALRAGLRPAAHRPGNRAGDSFPPAIRETLASGNRDNGASSEPDARRLAGTVPASCWPNEFVYVN